MRWRFFAMFLCAALPALAQVDGTRVLVIYSDKSVESERVAKYYASKRGIPKQNLCATLPEDHNAISWDEFNETVRQPARKCMKKIGADKDRSRVLYIVLAFDMPYKLYSMGDKAGLALDQYLADLWDETGADCSKDLCAFHQSHSPNPYFARTNARALEYPAFQSLEDYRKQPGAKTVYSVWHLDGATPELARGLVDKAIAAEQSGAWSAKERHACIDRRYEDPIQMNATAGYSFGEWMIQRAAEAAKSADFDVTEDRHHEEFGTAPAPLRCENALFYAGWYSLNHYNDAFSWAPGAVGFHLDSLSADHLRKDSNWVTNAVKHGITVTAGAVEEPFLDGLPRPDGILRDLLAGANAGDALLRNTAWMRWQVVNVGDPLYRPLAKH